MQAAGTGKWLAVHPDEQWMLVLVDEQPDEHQQFSMHRWGDFQVQIAAPSNKVHSFLNISAHLDVRFLYQCVLE